MSTDCAKVANKLVSGTPPSPTFWRTSVVDAYGATTGSGILRAVNMTSSLRKQADRNRMERPLTARIVEWNREKRYGFLQVGKERVFLHIHDFAEHHKRPEIGDKIFFIMGQDAQGRSCAKNALHVNDGGRITLANVLILAALLVLPTIALQRQAAAWRWVGAYALAINALTFAAYASDKRRARAKEERLPEAQLHLLELMGGWPGAFLAQCRFRHKCSKETFQVVFWLIVLVFQLVAFDSLQDWKYIRAALNHRERTSQNRR